MNSAERRPRQVQSQQLSDYVPLKWEMLRPRICPEWVLFVLAFLGVWLFWPERLLAGAVLSWHLAMLAVLDFRYGFLYDRLTAPLAGFGVIFLLLGALPHGAWSACEGAALGGGAFLLLRLLSRGGTGLGDAKLAAALGLWLGLSGTAVMLMLAVLLGGLLALVLLVRGASLRMAVPFGPFLSLGGYAAFLRGEELMEIYFSFIGV